MDPFPAVVSDRNVTSAQPNSSFHHQSGRWSLLLLLLTLFPTPAHATWLELSNLWLVTRLPQEKIARPLSRTSIPEQPIQVHLVIEARAAGQLPLYFTDAPGLDLGRGAIPTSQLRKWDNRIDGDIQIAWSQIEPEARSYDNLTPGFHLEPIQYQEVPIANASGRWTWQASVHPTLLPDLAPGSPTGVGIMRVKVRVVHQDYKLESVGAPGAFPGGIGEEILSVAYRGQEANPLLSWVQSRFNMPFVAGASKRGRGEDSHQAFLGVGSDGVELLAPAWRLAGHSEVNSVGLFLLDPTHEARSTVQLSRIRPEGDRYVDNMGEPARVGPDALMPGDLLRSGNDAGIFARDLPPLGLVDGNDLVVSALFHPPRLESLAASIHGPLTVLRWNEVRELQLDLKLLAGFKGNIDGKLSPELVAALNRLRTRLKLDSVDEAAVQKAMDLRGGINALLPPVAFFDWLRRNTRSLDLTPADQIALYQRSVEHLAQALGGGGEDGFVFSAPRANLPPEALARREKEVFSPQEEDFWNLEKAISGTAQSFPVADSNRDGLVDVSNLPAEVVTAGPALVLWTESDWQRRDVDNLGKTFGNQVWLYIPRAQLVVGYIGLGEVKVKAGDQLGANAILGTIGRTGSINRKRDRQTQLLVTAFSAADGRMPSVDIAAFWQKNLSEQTASWLKFPPAPVEGPRTGDGAGDATGTPSEPTHPASSPAEPAAPAAVGSENIAPSAPASGTAGEAPAPAAPASPNAP